MALGTTILHKCQIIKSSWIVWCENYEKLKILEDIMVPWPNEVEKSKTRSQKET